MPYNFTIEEKDDYIRCEVSGERRLGKELDDIMTVWSQVADLCIEKGISKIFAIFNLKGNLKAINSYELVSNADKFNWARQFKVALWDTNSDSRKHNLFTETVAVNRGYNMKVFENEESAMKWLLGS